MVAHMEVQWGTLLPLVFLLTFILPVAAYCCTAGLTGLLTVVMTDCHVGNYIGRCTGECTYWQAYEMVEHMDRIARMHNGKRSSKLTTGACEMVIVRKDKAEQVRNLIACSSTRLTARWLAWIPIGRMASWPDGLVA